MAEAPAIGIDLGTTYRYTRSAAAAGASAHAAGSHAENASQPECGQHPEAACAAADLMNSCPVGSFASYHACQGGSAL
jgi:hypothetical protein